MTNATEIVLLMVNASAKIMLILATKETTSEERKDVLTAMVLMKRVIDNVLNILPEEYRQQIFDAADEVKKMQENSSTRIDITQEDLLKSFFRELGNENS